MKRPPLDAVQTQISMWQSVLEIAGFWRWKAEQQAERRGEKEFLPPRLSDWIATHVASSANWGERPELVAQRAYDIADALITERKRRYFSEDI